MSRALAMLLALALGACGGTFEEEEDGTKGPLPPGCTAPAERCA